MQRYGDPLIDIRLDLSSSAFRSPKEERNDRRQQLGCCHEIGFAIGYQAMETVMTSTHSCPVTGILLQANVVTAGATAPQNHSSSARSLNLFVVMRGPMCMKASASGTILPTGSCSSTYTTGT